MSVWIPFMWVGGPNDGITGWVHESVVLPPARVCDGEVYIATRDDDGWWLEHAPRWNRQLERAQASNTRNSPDGLA